MLASNPAKFEERQASSSVRGIALRRLGGGLKARVTRLIRGYCDAKFHAAILRLLSREHTARIRR